MIYLLVVLHALWNGWSIRWKNLNKLIDSKQWHDTGLIIRVILTLLVFYELAPWPWVKYIFNPIVLIPGEWYPNLLAIGVMFGLSYPLYNAIINKIRGDAWDYQKWFKRGLYHFIIITWAVVLLGWILLGIFWRTDF